MDFLGKNELTIEEWEEFVEWCSKKGLTSRAAIERWVEEKKKAKMGNRNGSAAPVAKTGPWSGSSWSQETVTLEPGDVVLTSKDRETLLGILGRCAIVEIDGTFSPGVDLSITEQELLRELLN